MRADEIVARAQQDFTRLTRRHVDGVVGLSRVGEGWMVSLETVERKGIPDTMDMLAIYEVSVDAEGNAMHFERKSMRKRGQNQDR